MKRGVQERRLNESKRRLKLLIAVAVATVASLTRFLFSHPICLVDMPTAFSLTGKFMMPVSPPATVDSTPLADPPKLTSSAERNCKNEKAETTRVEVGRPCTRHDYDYRLATRGSFNLRRAVTSRRAQHFRKSFRKKLIQRMRRRQ